jgi:hypothetical protein
MINELTHAERERLVLLIEEMSEATRIACKVLRFGYNNRGPNDQFDNRFHLEKELGQVRYAMLLACCAGDLDKQRIHAAALSKAATIDIWVVHQSEALLLKTMDAADK